MTNQEEANKYILERHFFERFSNIYFGNSVIEFSKSEAPDFLVAINGEKIGVEVRQICAEKAENSKFSIVEKYSIENLIIERTKQHFNLRNKIPLNIRFKFADEFSLRKSEIPKVAKKLSEIIEKRIRNRSLNNNFNFFIDDELPKPVSEVSGYYFPEVTEAIWYSGKSMFLPSLKQEQIKSAIADKERKAPAYRKLADNLILLLIEGIPPYSWFANIENANLDRIDSCFDKIFIIRNLTNELIQIK